MPATSPKYGAANENRPARGVSGTKPNAYMVYHEERIRMLHLFQYPHHNEEGIQDTEKLHDLQPTTMLA
jgi:hypothetical protein